MTPRRRWLAGSLAVCAVLALLGGGTALAYRGDIAHGVEVLGVEVGGRSRTAAAALLRDRLDGRLTAPVTVRVGRTTVDLPPAALGLALDIDATLTRAARTRPDPFTALFGRRPVAPVVTVDGDRLHPALQRLTVGQAVGPVLPAIRFTGRTPVAVYPAPGRGIDRHRAAAILRGGWLRKAPVEVPISELVPRTSRDALDRLLHEVAAPAVAAPVRLRTGEGDVEVPPEALAASLRFESDVDGRVVPRVDEAALRRVLGDRLAPLEVPARNASLTLTDGRPVVVPHLDGRAVDLATLAIDLLPVLAHPAPRVVDAPLRVAPAGLTASTLAALGIREQVSTFTTRFVAGQSRVVNIRKVADLARGVLLRPGEMFSLNALTGDRTLAKGYVDAPLIANGKIKNGPGGGISQFATTAFNAAYYAGLQDVAHRPHSYHFSRYPAVIESTTIYPDLDMAFRNDSPHGILIDTSHTATSVTVTLWGTKRYDVATVWGPRTDEVPPRTVHLREEDCIPTEGSTGFRQEAWRVFKQDGREVRREHFAWRYAAEPKFICSPALRNT